ncbi:MAG: radical SAM protein [Candidatus Omnitrophota bacterium]
MNTKINKLKKILPSLKGLMKPCRLCPRRCGGSRSSHDGCYCRAGIKPAVYSHGPHHGEEPPLSGVSGSGTIFFTHCNMSCIYCQNHAFSQESDEGPVTIEQLAGIMLNLREIGCHNINLVSPTHYVPQIAEAILIALEDGLDVPIVYNTGGYDSPEVIKMLDGIVDVYLPDMRYSDDGLAEKYSNAPGYVGVNRACVREMQGQVGDLTLDADGIAVRGMIIRCLVMPGGVSGTCETLSFISEHVSRNAYVSLMSQYYPVYRAAEFPEISRRITDEEYLKCVEALGASGLGNGWVQSAPSGMDARWGGHRIRPKH